MTFSGWLSLGTEILLIGVVLGALARIGGVVYRLIRAEVRTWRIQHEKDAIWQLEQLDRECCQRYASPHPHLALKENIGNPRIGYIVSGGTVYSFDIEDVARRQQLEGLATASDKAERRIVH